MISKGHLEEAQIVVGPGPAPPQPNQAAIPAWGDQARSVRASRTRYWAIYYNPRQPYPGQWSERLCDLLLVSDCRMQDLSYHAIHEDGFPYARCFLLVIKHPTYRRSGKRSFSIAFKVSTPSKRLDPPGIHRPSSGKKKVMQAPIDRWITYPLKAPGKVMKTSV